MIECYSSGFLCLYSRENSSGFSSPTQEGTEVTDELCSHPVTAEDVNWELGLLPLPPAQLLCSHFKAECFISLASWALSVSPTGPADKLRCFVCSGKLLLAPLMPTCCHMWILLNTENYWSIEICSLKSHALAVWGFFLSFFCLWFFFGFVLLCVWLIEVLNFSNT